MPFDGRTQGGVTPKAYLSACMMYRNHASYLREWVEFHRLVGVERFFLYDNGSSDDHLEALAPYLGQELVVLHEFPKPFPNLPYKECLEEHSRDSRWIAFIDIDEFLFSPTGRPVPEILREYEEFPGIGVNHAVFGSSDHKTRPPGPVIESYLRRADNRTNKNRRYKSIVDPLRVANPWTAHHFAFHEGVLVDEQRRPISGGFTEGVSFSRLRINHYVTKSEEEYREKSRIRAKFSPVRDFKYFPELDASLSAEFDDTITAYVPTLREALARTATGEGAARAGPKPPAPRPGP